MNELEKAAVAFVGMLCERLQELVTENNRLSKELMRSGSPDSVKALQNEIASLREERDSYRRRVNELEAQLPKPKRKRERAHT